MAIHEKMYRFYRKAGMTHAGAAAMLSMCQHESAFRSNNLEDTANRKFRVSDEEYTRQVVAGIRDFIDGYGYGLFQWTYPTRKQGLLTFAATHGVSLDDEDMQLRYSIHEFQTEYEFRKCWDCLCTCENVDTCAEMATKDYEKPANAVAAVAVRIKSAREWATKFRDLNLDTPEPAPMVPKDGQPPFKYYPIPMPLLGLEREGDGVVTLQAALIFRGYIPKNDPIGYYGKGTKEAVELFQRAKGLSADGIAGQDTFTELMKM